ncbi:GNAT family N-acetyltransferase [Staphylococcus americanisciuri]|uniref:N-acetyltransferase n=1 Tax=Staphylococcus americanisciuri TaxID=2973940 RepID=A0ABT2F4H4_9STAP|nr:N-acetyltransferase [Staphylococcus americanisciuri]MCS4487353.1 N-acetyltransferase [Staphylococcus americanisciuri]
MSIFISTLTEMDYELSLQMIENAFEETSESEQDEVQHVKRLRMAPDYRYELEVIAKTADDDIIGHAMCSEVKIESEEETYVALVLASLSVLNAYQQKGIGAALVQALEERAYAQEYTTIVVLGHPDFYAQLGYEIAAKHGITVPFNMPDEAVRVKFLWDTLEDLPHGEVHYPKQFFGV